MSDHIPFKIWFPIVFFCALIPGYFIWTISHEPFPVESNFIIHHEK